MPVDAFTLRRWGILQWRPQRAISNLLEHLMKQRDHEEAELLLTKEKLEEIVLTLKDPQAVQLIEAEADKELSSHLARIRFLNKSLKKFAMLKKTRGLTALRRSLRLKGKYKN